VLTNRNLHAWTEVYFTGFGWVPFDPTPAGDVIGSRRTPLPSRVTGAGDIKSVWKVVESNYTLPIRWLQGRLDPAPLDRPGLAGIKHFTPPETVDLPSEACLACSSSAFSLP